MGEIMRLKKAIAYIRRSTKKQKYSETAQRNEIEEFAVKHNFEVIRFYQETASGKTMDRPELKKAIHLTKQKRLPIIVVSICRIGRVAKSVINLIDENRFISIEDGLSADKSTLHISAAQAEREGERISRRTKNACSVAKEEGKKLGNPNIHEIQPRGTKAGQKKADEFALRFEKLFDLMEYESHSAMARELNKWDIKTRRGKQWRAQTVINLRNRLKQIKEERQREEDNVGDLFEYVAQMFESGDFNPGLFE